MQTRIDMAQWETNDDQVIMNKIDDLQSRKE